LLAAGARRARDRRDAPWRPRLEGLLARHFGLAGAGLVAAAVVFAALASAAAASSLPGDALYPVKTAGERLRIGLAGAARADVLAELELERRREVAALATQGRAEEVAFACGVRGASASAAATVLACDGLDGIEVRLGAGATPRLGAVLDVQGRTGLNEVIVASMVVREEGIRLLGKPVGTVATGQMPATEGGRDLSPAVADPTPEPAARVATVRAPAVEPAGPALEPAAPVVVVDESPSPAADSAAGRDNPVPTVAPVSDATAVEMPATVEPATSEPPSATPATAACFSTRPR
jgi:hypothetical protein